MPYIPSEEEVNQRGDGFLPLPEDDYIVSVKEYELKPNQPNPFNRTEQYPAGVPRDVLNVKMTVHSFSNGDDLYDSEGTLIPPTREPLFFDFLDTSKTGMKPRPSKWRTFVAAVFGQPVGSSIEFDSWEDLKDKRFVASVIIKSHPEKGDRNAVVGYKTARKRPVPRPATPAPSTQPADMTAAASEVFGDDIVPF